MRLAIIGYGGMAECHVNHFIAGHNKSDGVEKIEVTGVFDIDPARNRAARENGLYVYDRAEALLGDATVDAVLIATPNDVHCAYTVAAAAAGKHILCEKPAAMNVTEVEQMYEAAAAAGVILYIHQNRRWDADFLTVKKIIEDGSLGRVYRISSHVTGSHGIPGTWRRQKSNGGGMLLDWGVHQIDQILQLYHEPIHSVHCSFTVQFGSEVDEGYCLTLGLESGVTVYIETDTNTFMPLPRWRVYGVTGTAEIEDWALKGKMVTVRSRRDEALKAVKAGNGLTKTMAERSEETVDTVPLPKVEADAFALYRNFAAAVRLDAPPLIKQEEVLRVFRVIEAAFLSAQSGDVIKTSI